MKLVVQSRDKFDPGALDSESALYIPDTLCLQTLEQWFEEYGRPGALITTAHPELPIDIPCFYFPTCLRYLSRILDQDGFIPDSSQTQFTHNFMANKKYYWRIMLIKLIEWYGLDNGNYTWSGIGDRIDWSHWLNDLDRFLPQDIKAHVLQPVCIPPKFIKSSDGNCISNGAWVNNCGSILTVWNEIIHPIFANSAVSLITESVGNDNICIFTEKTLFSVLGLTFPIWCVGYRAAEHWKNHGFDVFDDVIDHSYQFMQSPVQRCFESIRLNLALLQDRDRLMQTRTRCMSRLVQNRSRMMDNISNVFATYLNRVPDSVQHALKVAKLL